MSPEKEQLSMLNSSPRPTNPTSGEQLLSPQEALSSPRPTTELSDEEHLDRDQPGENDPSIQELEGVGMADKLSKSGDLKSDGPKRG